MKKARINVDKNAKAKLQDKSDWVKIFNMSQGQADAEAMNDKDNPVLKNAKFKRLKDKSKAE